MATTALQAAHRRAPQRRWRRSASIRPGISGRPAGRVDVVTPRVGAPPGKVVRLDPMSYLDHAATTPMLPEALDAYLATARLVGNASSLHAPGRQARRLVEEARERIAAALGARPSEVIFTGGGTEADNLAVKGIFWARRDANGARLRVVSSAVEHHAVLDAVHWLVAHEGAQVSWLPVDGLGRIRAEALAAELDGYGDQVAVVTAM